MAGKHTGAFSPFPDGSGAVPGFAFNPRLTLAYAEGRAGDSVGNHLQGSEADLARASGFVRRADPAYQFETILTGDGGGFPADASHYDGSSQAERTSNFTGVSASSQFTISAWLRLDDNVEETNYLFSTPDNRIRMFRNVSGRMTLTLSNAGGSQLVNISAPENSLPSAIFHHFIVSGDLDAGTLLGFWDGSSRGVQIFTNNPGDVDFDQARFLVGQRTTIEDRPWVGCIGELYYNTKDFVNLIQPAELAKFILPDGSPADLGTNGQLPTGNQPTFYSKDGGRGLLNSGDGGNLNTYTGTATACTIPGPQI